MDSLADIGNRTSEKKAAQDHGAYPERAAKNVEGQISAIGHETCACHGRTEGANDGHEAGKDDRASAVFFVEIMGPLKVGAAKKEGLFAVVERVARGAADPITELIAHDGASHHRKQQPAERDISGSGKDTGGHEKGITGKKEADEKTGFNEDDEANQGRSARVN